MVWCNNTLWIIPKPQDKPIRIVYPGYPCPIDSRRNCEHANIRMSEFDIEIYCKNYKCPRWQGEKL